MLESFNLANVLTLGVFLACLVFGSVSASNTLRVPVSDGLPDGDEYDEIEWGADEKKSNSDSQPINNNNDDQPLPMLHEWLSNRQELIHQAFNTRKHIQQLEQSMINRQYTHTQMLKKEMMDNVAHVIPDFADGSSLADSMSEFWMTKKQEQRKLDEELVELEQIKQGSKDLWDLLLHRMRETWQMIMKEEDRLISQFLMEEVVIMSKELSLDEYKKVLITDIVHQNQLENEENNNNAHEKRKMLVKSSSSEFHKQRYKNQLRKAFYLGKIVQLITKEMNENKIINDDDSHNSDGDLNQCTCLIPPFSIPSGSLSEISIIRNGNMMSSLQLSNEITLQFITAQDGIDEMSRCPRLSYFRHYFKDSHRRLLEKIQSDKFWNANYLAIDAIIQNEGELIDDGMAKRLYRDLIKNEIEKRYDDDTQHYHRYSPSSSSITITNHLRSFVIMSLMKQYRTQLSVDLIVIIKRIIFDLTNPPLKTIHLKNVDKLKKLVNEDDHIISSFILWINHIYDYTDSQTMKNPNKKRIWNLQDLVNELIIYSESVWLDDPMMPFSRSHLASKLFDLARKTLLIL